MRIDLRDEHRRRRFTVEVDETDPPAMARPPRGEGRPIGLDWDGALDDESHLRRCPVCGCPDLWQRQRVPRVTGFAVLVLAGVAALVLLGFDLIWPAVAVLAGLLVMDALIWWMPKRILVCYRCRSQFSRLPIRRRHPRWSPSLEQHHAPSTEAEPETRP